MKTPIPTSSVIFLETGPARAAGKRLPSFRRKFRQSYKILARGFQRAGARPKRACCARDLAVDLFSANSTDRAVEGLVDCCWRIKNFSTFNTPVLNSIILIRMSRINRMIQPMIPPKGPQVQLIVFVIIFAGLIVPACADSTDIRYGGGTKRRSVGCRSTAMGNTGVCVAFRRGEHVLEPGRRGVRAFLRRVGRIRPALWWFVKSSVRRLSGAASGRDKRRFDLRAFFSGDISRWDTLPGTYLERQIDPTLRADGSNKAFLPITRTFCPFLWPNFSSCRCPAPPATAIRCPWSFR